MAWWRPASLPRLFHRQHRLCHRLHAPGFRRTRRPRRLPVSLVLDGRIRRRGPSQRARHRARPRRSQRPPRSTSTTTTGASPPRAALRARERRLAPRRAARQGRPQALRLLACVALRGERQPARPAAALDPDALRPAGRRRPLRRRLRRALRRIRRRRGARACAAARTTVPVYTPINEISFLAWAVSETHLIHPYRREIDLRKGEGGAHRDIGWEAKWRLVRAALLRHRGDPRRGSVGALPARRAADPHRAAAPRARARLARRRDRRVPVADLGHARGQAPARARRQRRGARPDRRQLLPQLPVGDGRRLARVVRRRPAPRHAVRRCCARWRSATAGR